MNFFQNNTNHNILKAAWLATPLGQMLAIVDDGALYLLEFEERLSLAQQIEKLLKKTKSSLVLGRTVVTNSIEEELASYFLGNLKMFKTPTKALGTPFQKKVWQELSCIPYGETRSYLAQAEAIDCPGSFRAVANANGSNNLAIIIPCHRIINKNGALGGYAGGVERKKWLLEHEKANIA